MSILNKSWEFSSTEVEWVQWRSPTQLQNTAMQRTFNAESFFIKWLFSSLVGYVSDFIRTRLAENDIRCRSNTFLRTENETVQVTLSNRKKNRGTWWDYHDLPQRVKARAADVLNFKVPTSNNGCLFCSEKETVPMRYMWPWKQAVLCVCQSWPETDRCTSRNNSTKIRCLNHMIVKIR